MPAHVVNCLFALLLTVTVASAPAAYAQSQPPPVSVTQPASVPEPGSVTGTIVDKDEAVIANAKITLSKEGQTTTKEAISASDGQFAIPNVEPGPFEITVSANGFATQIQSGILQPGQNYIFPEVQLAVASAVVDVEVTIPKEQIAEEQIHVEEKQRIFGAIPNYFVSYVPNAASLTTRQKFELATKSAFDPVSFGIAGVIAGLEQASNTFPGYGQGMQGYGKRYGQTFADLTIGTYIGSAMLPSLLKQDPRYFYKGTGSKKSRFLYALANAVICKGDNGKWQPNYSNVLGSFAAGGISNLYLSSVDRNGARVTFENGLIGIAGTAGAGVVQEFFLRRITPHVPNAGPAGN